MSVRVNIRGIKNVDRNAEQLEKDLIKAVYGAMIITAMVDIETGAKKKLRDDLHVDTGRLRASIHTTYKDASSFIPEQARKMKQPPVVKTHTYQARSLGKKRKNKKRGQRNPLKQYDDSLTVNRKKYNVFVGTNVVYARRIEMIDSYLYYAFKNSKASLNKRMKREVRKVIGKKRNRTGQ